MSIPRTNIPPLSFPRRCGVHFCFLFMVLPVIACAQKKIETSYPDGSIKERYFVIQTDSDSLVKEGIYRAFHKNGNKKKEISYVRGIKEGPTRSWYENGRIRCLITFKKGRLNGPAKWYHSNGELAIIGYYGDNGQREYLWQLFHRNGEQCARISYNDGMIEKKEYFAPDSVIDSMFKEIENPEAKKRL